MGQVRSSYSRFARSGSPPPLKITDDDIAILRYVHRYRFIRADDLYRLFEKRSSDRLSRRLTLLYRAGYLDRPIAQIDRFKAGGSQPFVYGLDAAGARCLKERLGVPIGSTDWKARNRSYSRDNLDHTILISRFMVDLELDCRWTAGMSLIAADEIIAGGSDATRRKAKPGVWPVNAGWCGRQSEVQIAPDAMFGLRHAPYAQQPRIAFVFLEMDRGTMTIEPSRTVQDSDAFLHRATILRKLICYAESHRQRAHAAHFNIPSARVLTLTTSADRARTMQMTARRIIRHMQVPAGLFLFGTIEDARNPLTAAFRDAEGGEARFVR